MEVSQVLNLVDPLKGLESEEYISGSITDSYEIVLSIKLNSLKRCFLASHSDNIMKDVYDRMNIKIKFVHENIMKDVYVIRPECFVDSKDAGIDASLRDPVMD